MKFDQGFFHKTGKTDHINNNNNNINKKNKGTEIHLEFWFLMVLQNLVNRFR